MSTHYVKMDDFFPPVMKKMQDTINEKDKEIEQLKLEIEIRKEMYEKLIDKLKVV